MIEGIAVASGAGRPTIPTYVLSAARMGTIAETVSGTGQVEGESQINVTPQGSGGQVVSVNVTPGQKVSLGQVLVVLNDSTALSTLSQAQANLASAQANYTKVVEGLTPEQQVADQTSVTNATQSLVTSLISSYTQINNILRTQIDTVFSNPTTQNPVFDLSLLSSNGSSVTFTSIDPVLVAKINSERAGLNTLLPAWQSDVQTLSLMATSTADLNQHVTLVLNDLQFIANFLNDLSNAVYGVSSQNTSFSNAINSYKSTVASALQTADSQISSVVSSNQSLVTAQANYNVNTAPPTNADVQSAQASVVSAEASLQSAQVAYNDTQVTAPFAGEIGSVGVQVGDVVSGSTAVATLTTTQKIADISLNEVDAATVHVGDPAMLTFNALPNVTIPAYVSQMSQVGTVSSGVVDYDVKLSLATSTKSFASLFSGGKSYKSIVNRPVTGSSTISATTAANNFEQNFQQTLSEIKPGMSVTANIITKSDSNAIIVPSSAIKSTTGGRGSYVQELPGATAAGQVQSTIAPSTVTVTTGIVNGTETEILSGLTQGDLVITQTLHGTTVAPVIATPAQGGFRGGGGRVLFGG